MNLWLNVKTVSFPDQIELARVVRGYEFETTPLYPKPKKTYSKGLKL